MSDGSGLSNRGAASRRLAQQKTRLIDALGLTDETRKRVRRRLLSTGKSREEDITAALDDITAALDGITAARDGVTAARDDVTVALDDVTAALDGVTAACDGVTAARDDVTTALDPSMLYSQAESS